MPVIARSARFVNTSSKPINFRHASSASSDFPNNEFYVISLHGWHIAERTIQRQFEISSTSGTSSHQQSPFIALVRPDITEFAGEVYAASLFYSGGFIAKIEAEQFRTTRLTIGLNPAVFNWCLEPDEDFQTPEMILNYSADSLNGMSQAYHRFYREHLIRGKFKNQVRPILINNWEASYFDFYHPCGLREGFEAGTSDFGRWLIRQAQLRQFLTGRLVHE